MIKLTQLVTESSDFEKTYKKALKGFKKWLERESLYAGISVFYSKGRDFHDSFKFKTYSLMNDAMSCEFSFLVSIILRRRKVGSLNLEGTVILSPSTQRPETKMDVVFYVNEKEYRKTRYVENESPAGLLDDIQYAVYDLANELIKDKNLMR